MSKKNTNYDAMKSIRLPQNPPTKVMNSDKSDKYGYDWRDELEDYEDY